jgi:large subunit ribosomal protein L6
MGRIPVSIPSGVTVNIGDGNVTIKGPKGSIMQSYRPEVKIVVEDGKVIFTTEGKSKFVKALHGTYRALVNNMVKGVTSGFEKVLEINGVGYRGRIDGKKLVLQVGKSHEVEHDIPEGLKVEVDKNVTIKVTGIDKHLVGQWAAIVRATYPPEPFLGKGIRYKGEYVRRKAGKKVAGT